MLNTSYLLLQPNKNYRNQLLLWILTHHQEAILLPKALTRSVNEASNYVVIIEYQPFPS